MSLHGTPSAASALGVTWSSCTSAGRRSYNQDQLGAWRGDAGALLVAADGLGGHVAGEVAARIAVQTIVETARTSGRIDDLVALARAAGDEIRGHAERQPQHKGLGTTVVAAAVVGGELRHVHAGDSCLFLLRGGELEGLTPPHELASILVREGVLREDEADTSPVRGRLTSYLGSESPEFTTGSRPLQAGDRLALVTDGVLEGGVDRLREALVQPDLSRAAFTAVRGYATQDNASALVADIHGTE